MDHTRGKSGRWQSFSFMELMAQALAFAVGVAVTVALALAFSQEPEELGRAGMGGIIMLFLAITPILFTLGFMAAEAERPHQAAGLRTLRSASCGVVYVGGWLILGWVVYGIDSLWPLPEAVGSIAFLAYWLVGPLLLPTVVWRVGRIRADRPTHSVVGDHGAA
jgi:hypothetical protein